MPTLVTHKTGQVVLIGLATALWLGASVLVRESWDWYFVFTYFIGGFSFFLAACFLPEYLEKRFASRQSALASMAFFFWLSVNACRRVPIMKDWLSSVSSLTSLLVIGALVAAIGSYFLAIFLIRGFRAAPERHGDTKPS